MRCYPVPQAILRAIGSAVAPRRRAQPRRLLPYYLRTSVPTQPHDHRCTLPQLSKKEALGPRRNRGSITTTLYVTDEGEGVTTFNPGTNRYTDAAAQTKAGLQKWIFDAGAGTWKLAYVLQAGLDLGVPYTISNYPTGTNPVTGLPWSPATDGLRNLTGRVHPNEGGHPVDG
jgi:hypothetical protein